MKTLLLLIAAFLFGGQLVAQNIKPGVRTTFHLVDEKGKPVSDEDIEVRVTFSKKDANGNKVDIYVEKFLSRTTHDGYFQREIGAKFGDIPTVLFGKYEDVDFTDPDLCIRIDFRRTQVWPMDWVIGKWSMLNPVPLAAQVLNDQDGDKDAKNEIQKISKAGDEIFLSKDGGSIVLNDDDPTNELQILDYDPVTKTLYLQDGNSVDLSSLSPFMDNGSQLCTTKELQATRFTTKNGRTDIEEGKISFRYSTGQDGIEMGVDDQNGLPFISFIDKEGNTLATIRMGPQGFKMY